MRIGKLNEQWESIKNRYTHFPEPAMPEPMVTIPSNPDDLHDMELDRCLLSFGAWRGYTASKLALVDARLTLLEDAYHIRLGDRMADLEAKAPKKMLKESLIGKAVKEDEELSSMQFELAALRSEKTLLSRQYDLFNGQFEVVSRVVTRRSWERKRGT